MSERRSPFDRVRLEARSAAVLARAWWPIAAHTPPHRYLGAARGAQRGGTVAALTGLLAGVHGDRPAVVDDHGTLTYRELDDRSARLAGGLTALGVQPGDGVGLLCRNHRHVVEALLASAVIGARLVLLNTEFSGPQLADVVSRERVRLLVHDAEFAVVADSTSPELGRVVAWTDGPGEDPTVDDLVARGLRPPRRWAVTPEIVLLTSGTTGTPKGASRTSNDAVPSLRVPAGMLDSVPFRARSTVFVVPPLFHAWGFGALLVALGLGSTLVVTRSVRPADQWQVLTDHAIDTLVTVPTQLDRLVRHADDADLTPRAPLRLVATSGSALSPSLAARAMDRLGDVVHDLYGSTESGYVAVAGPADLRSRPGTVGRPPLGTVVRILDDQGAEVPIGTTGRIFADSGMPFGGYTGGGDKERAGSLISTGDLGHLDSDGYLFVEGRSDDMIVSGGENVYPEEVDACLQAHPAVRDSATVGVPDEEFGQRLRSHVVADGVTVDALRDHVRSQLARYKVPRDIVLCDEIPRNATGKVLRRALTAD